MAKFNLYSTWHCCILLGLILLEVIKKQLLYITYACNQHKCNTFPLQREKGNGRNILFSCFHSM